MDFTQRPNYASSAFEAVSPSTANAMETGTDSHKLQLMKASFFVDDDFDGKSGRSLIFLNIFLIDFNVFVFLFSCFRVTRRP